MVTVIKPLAISRIEAFPVDLPLHTPINLGGRLKMEKAETVVVRIESATGIVGWGESASAPDLTGEIAEGMVAAIRTHLAPAITGGHARTLAQLGDDLARAAPGHMAAKAAVDLALHDLFGRALGVPVSELLGGAQHKRVAAMWTIGNATMDADVNEARARRREGYRVFKLKVGSRTLEADIETARHVRDAVGGDAALAVDANATWNQDKAIRFLEATKELGLAYVEQPVRADHLAEMARIAASGSIPVCADEGIGSIADIEAHAARHAATGISLKPIKLGGLAPARFAAERCSALNMRVNLASKIAESSIAVAGLLHLAAALKTLDWAVTATNHYLAGDLVRGGLTPSKGGFDIPTGPGLGVEVDPAALGKYWRR